MTTRTKTREQAPVIDADEVAERYVTALTRRTALRRNSLRDLEDQGSAGYLRASAQMAAADEAVRDTRAALESAWGPAAVRLAEARAEHQPIAAELANAQAQYRNPGHIADLAARERAASLRVQQAAGEAEAERSRAAEREMLEAEHRPLLGKLDASLTEAAAGLAGAVQAAQAALVAVHAAAERYGAVAADARRQLAAKGFAGERKFSGEPWATTASPLRVSGTDWPEPHPQRVAAWAMAQSIGALGMVGSPLDYALKRQTAVDQRPIELLLCNRRAAK